MRPMRFWTLAAAAAVAFFTAATPAAQADDGSVIDVLIAYTPEVLNNQAGGSQATVVAAINRAVSDVNTALTNSGVLFQLRIVATAQVDFNGTPGGDDVVLQQLQSQDGVADALLSLRETTKADIVHMVLDPTDFTAGCGGGFIMGPNDVGPQFAPRAFSITQWSCLNYVGAAYQLGHAIGHNMGLQHAAQDSSHHNDEPAFPYGRGYRDPQNRFRDIMAEDLIPCSSCPNRASNGDYNIPRVQMFSNTTRTVNGAPIGDASTSDAARALNDVRVIVANFRSAASATPTATPNPGGAPGQPTLTGPTGTTGPNPTYSWNAVSGAAEYFLWVNNSSSTAVIQTWLQASAVCSGATCSVTPSTSLAAGGHTFWIQARNSAGTGPWSGGRTFTVGSGGGGTATPTPTPNPGGAPGQPTLVGPNGTTGANPTYSWNAVAGAAEYFLWVNNSSSTAVIQTWLQASAVCSGATCSVTPSTSLASGGHTFWIQARNSTGTGPWSGGMAFTVSSSGGTPTATPTPTPTPTPGSGSAPGQPTLVSPSGNTTVSRPTYTWNAVTGAAEYMLWVNTSGGTAMIQTWLQASAVCSGSTCSVTPTTTLGNGSYTWWTRARNAAGQGPWSAGLDFTVNVSGFPPTAATLVSPSGSGSRTPTYTWNAVSGATDYYLWVNNNASSSAVVQVWLSGATVCSGSTCSFTPGGTLAAGSHTWWIQTRNSVGTGPWSSGLTFNAQ